MDDELVRIAHTAAASIWRSARNAHQSAWDGDDLRQVALMAVWEWSQAHPNWREDEAQGIAYTVAQRRVIDWLRHVGGRKGYASGKYANSPFSLDEPVSQRGTARDDVTRLDITADDRQQDDLERVERAHDLAHAFASYRGPARNAAAAWLAANGHALADIGAHYGVTESRACQYRTAFIAAVRHEWSAPGRGAEPEAA